MAIKLKIDFTFHRYYQIRPFSKMMAYIDLLMKASPVDTDDRKKGEVIMDVRKVAQEWGWTDIDVSILIQELKSMREVVTIKENGYIKLIKMVEYDSYAV